MIANHDTRLRSRHRDPRCFQTNRKCGREPDLRDETSDRIGKYSVGRRDENGAETLDSTIGIRGGGRLDELQ